MTDNRGAFLEFSSGQSNRGDSCGFVSSGSAGPGHRLFVPVVYNKPLLRCRRTGWTEPRWGGLVGSHRRVRHRDVALCRVATQAHSPTVTQI